MKKKIELLIVVLIIIILGVIIGFLIKKDNKNNASSKDLIKIPLAEVTHSPFYAPLYVAIENNYFQELGLDVELILTPGADKVATSVISGDALIGFAGPESAIYVYNGDEKDYLVTFAGLTKRDGQFIVSREKTFSWEDLIGKEILVGRQGGMPALNFLNALKKVGIDENKVNINYSIDFASLSGAFIGNTGDYVNLFEPNATLLEKENLGYVVESIGKYSGEMPYTAFYTKKSYFENNKEVLEKFNLAINKGLQFVFENSSKTIAQVIIKQFTDTNIDDLEKIIERYKENDCFLKTSFISETMYRNLEDIMIDNNLLEDYVPYNDLVKNLTNE